MILYIFIFAAFGDCELKKLSNYYTRVENLTYINRREKQPVVYRGMATTQGEALEMVFDDLKKGKCPDKIISKKR